MYNNFFLFIHTKNKEARDAQNAQHSTFLNALHIMACTPARCAIRDIHRKEREGE